MKEKLINIINNSGLEMMLGLFMLMVVSLMVNNSEEISAKIDDTKNAGATHIVAIDAGHGGIDPGKVGINDCLEKDINLSIAFMVKELLESEGVTVYMTRENDDGLYSESDTNKKVSDLNKRCSIIDACNAEIAVCIHQNSYSDNSVSGGQVFYYAASEEGVKLAQDIQVELAMACGKTRQAKANKDYYMLLNVKCPIVIVECGFLSNWEEAQLLTTEDYQHKLAEAIVKGIMEYLDGKS